MQIRATETTDGTPFIEGHPEAEGGAEAQSATFKVNYWHISMFMLLVSMAGCTNSYGKDMTN